MFSGIIQDIGSINLIEEGLYEVKTNLNLKDCIEGSSISCNGVCLTATKIKKNKDNKFSFLVNIGEETLTRTNLGQYISRNENINLEKSLRIGDEISGHFVYGHVDTTTILKKIKLNNSWEFHFEKKFEKYNKFILKKHLFQ